MLITYDWNHCDPANDRLANKKYHELRNLNAVNIESHCT